jgi:propanol-preferring alcohol dehydrogenase
VGTAALHFTDTARTDAGSLGELFLRQPSAAAVLAHQLAEARGRVDYSHAATRPVLIVVQNTAQCRARNAAFTRRTCNFTSKMVSRLMRAMLLRAPRTSLQLVDVAEPIPGDHQVLLRVRACGVCRTDLHIVDGELDQPKLPLVLGHEVVATVEACGSQARAYQIGERVGVPWLGWTDQTCRFCARGQENLCDAALFTGYTLDGGYADYLVADERYCLRLPSRYTDLQAAPLLCAGLIGYRTYRLAGASAEHVGIYGFGAAAHIVAQIAVHQGRQVYAFTRPGDTTTQTFARQLGAVWAAGSDETPPHALDAALIFAPVGELMISALRVTAKGGVVVSGGIYMSDVPSFAYRLLWEERELRSVANLTRRDGQEFMALAEEVPIEVSVQPFELADANQALDRVRRGQLQGAAVLSMSPH